MIDSAYREIPLTQGQVTVVDEADYTFLNQWIWCAQWSKTTRSWYARQSHGGRMMHSLLLDLQKGEHGDHRDHDTLNNRRCNLRKATRSQSMMNRRTFSNNKSGHPGVHWHKRDKKWAVYIHKDKKQICLGYFPADQKGAAIARRREAEKEHHGEFAYNPHRSG